MISINLEACFKDSNLKKMAMDILNQGYLSNMGERGYKELCPPLIGFVRDNTHLNFMIKAKHGIEFYSTQNKYEADLKVCDMTAKAI